MENSMIQSKGLSPHCWKEYVNCANYIVDWIHIKDLKYLAWSIIPNVIHFCVFGSEARYFILMRKGEDYNLKVRSAFLLDILKIQNDVYLFNFISNDILIMRDINFYEGLLEHEPNLVFFPSSFKLYPHWLSIELWF